MPHIAHKGVTLDRPEVHEDWLAATATANTYTAKAVRGMEAFKVRIGPGLAPESGTAQWNPLSREIEIAAQVMLPGVRPEAVDFMDELFRERYPLAVGALVHETSHALFSQTTPYQMDVLQDSLIASGHMDKDAKLTRVHVDVLVALEEHTCEWKMWRRQPGLQRYLPAIVFDLLGRDFKIGDDAYGAGGMVALLLARADAGTLGARTVKPFRDEIAKILTEDQITTLLGLAEEYRNLDQMLADHYPAHEQAASIAAMRSIAVRWLETLGIDPEATPEAGGITIMIDLDGEESDESGDGDGEEDGDGGSGSASDGSEDGEEDGDGSQAAKDGKGGEEGRDKARKFSVSMRDMVAEAKHIEWIRHVGKVGDVKAKRELERRAIEAERKRVGAKAAGKAFPSHGYTETERMGASSVTWLDPTAKERAAATLLAKELERIVATEPVITETKMNRPGKRVLGRGIVQRKAQAMQGRVPTADYWKGRHRAMPDVPPITIGVMMDISGSMRAAAHPLASTSFVIANAVERLGGKFAVVAFGSGATGLVAPGQRLQHKPFISPHDGTEAFREGFNALDAKLDLVNGEGAKILVMLSDGVFVSSRDAEYADQIIGNVLPKNGAITVHIDVDGNSARYDGHGYNVRHNNPDPIVNTEGMEPLAVAKMVGTVIKQRVAAQVAARR